MKKSTFTVTLGCALALVLSWSLVASAGESSIDYQVPSLRDVGGSFPGINMEPTHMGWVPSLGVFAPPGPPGGPGAAAARAAYGVDGNGIRVGVISDAYNSLGGAPGGVLSGDLPGAVNPNGYLTPVNVVKDDLAVGRIDEGRAMAEIVHDLAPGAHLYFHSAFNNAGGSPGQQIAHAVNNLVAAGCDVIVDDVFYLNEPYFQDGVAAQAVDNAKAAGVAYFSSAGNQANYSYEGSYVDSGTSGFHDFDLNANEGGDIELNISVPNNAQVRVTVEWDDPYPSVGAPGNAADYDVGLYDYGLGGFVSTSVYDQTAGADPWELVGAVNTSGGAVQYGLMIQHYAGSTDRLLKAIVYDSGSIADDDDTDSPTVTGHAAADGGEAIAAIRYDSVNTVEWFSSLGPSTILFDTAGNPILDIRDTPELTATDGVDTTFFGSDYESNGWPNFFGTSASAPHAAAVAALMLDRANQLSVPLSVDEIYDILELTAIDIETAGFDDLSGFGLIDADAAVGSVIPEPGTMVLLLAGTAFGLIGFIRRGRKRAA